MSFASPRLAPLRAALIALTVAGLCGCGSSTPSAPLRTSSRSSVVRSGGGAAARPRDPSPVAPIQSVVTLDLAHPAAPVPGRFVGLSFEASTLDHFGRYGTRGDLAALLRSLGPGVIRFGGISADTRAAWVDALRPRPAWAGWAVTRQMLRGVAQFARRSGWRVLLTVGLAHYDPAAAAREVAAAHALLGPYLEAVEIGNEPDSYATHGLRDSSWDVGQYAAEMAAYRRAIGALTPGVSIVAPDVSGSRAFARWGAGTADLVHPALLTGHHYPLGCKDAVAPTIARLLSPAVRQAEGLALDRYQALAAAHHVRFRLDETGSVSCGGRPGVSDTFASALWALDISLRAMTTGISGINFEGNVAHCNTYTPICARTPVRLLSGVLSPQPEWYALLMASELAGKRPLHVHVTPARANLDVAGFAGADGSVAVVVVNDAPAGSGNAVLHIAVGRRFGSGRVLRLEGPSVEATSGVTLGGRAVGRGGAWSPPRRLPVRVARRGVVTVGVRPGSASLVTLLPVGRGRAHGRGRRG